MARKIAETPVLRGKDAKAFIKAMNEAMFKKVSDEEKERINRNYLRMKSIKRF